MSVEIKDSAGVSINYDRGSVACTDNVNSRGVANFSVNLDAATFPIDIGQDVFIFDEGVLVWGGTIESAEETDIQKGAGSHRRIVYVATDFDGLVRRKRIAAVYEDKTSGFIVSDVITNHFAVENVTEGTITPGKTLTKINFSYRTGTQVMDELALLNGFHWKLDKSKALQFQARSENIAPWSIGSGTNDYTSMRRTRTRSQYRNKQIVRGGTKIDEGLVETIAGDGQRLAHLVSKEVKVVTLIETNIASGGWNSKTFAVIGETGSDFYYQEGSHTISQDSGGTVLNAADLLRVTFDAQINVIIEAEDGPEILLRAAIEEGDGEYHEVHTDTSIEDVDIAIETAHSLLERFGVIPEKVRFRTHRSGLEAGQIIMITNARLNLSGDYLIESVTFAIRDDNKFSYDVLCSSGESLGGWVKWFEMIQGRPGNMVIRGNEILFLMRSVLDEISVDDEAHALTRTTFGFTIGDTRTNLFLQSQTLGVAPWGDENISNIANDTLAPDGTVTADKLVENSATSTHDKFQIVPTVSGRVYTMSVFARADERSIVRVYLGDGGFGAASGAWFDMSTGLVGTVGIDVGSALMVPAGDGWYRCIVTGTSDTTTAANAAAFYVCITDGAVSYAGDGSSGLHLWGAQFEEGDDASLYIVTVGSTVSAIRDCKIGIETFG